MSRSKKTKVIWRSGPYFVEVAHGRWFFRHDDVSGSIAELINPKPTDDVSQWLTKKASDRIKSSAMECEKRTRMLEEAQAKHKMWLDVAAAISATRVEGGGA